ncbi:MAG TPA: TMEM175 family protein [Solirubrobacterales bacterium]|nr:TMEM175 family protein [Solirubrobacterales bacterium]
MDGAAESTDAESGQRELDRVGGFSDGVFAVAITLLVLNIEVPQLSEGEKLTAALDDLVPDVTAYFIAFAVIGLFWYGHHKAWSRLQATSPRLVWSNLVLLSLIALMPFTTDLMGSYGDQSISVVLFAANVGLAALADSHVDKVAFDAGLAAPVSAGQRRAQLLTGRIRSLVFFASIPIAFASPTLAQLSWLALLLLPWVGRRAAHY